MGKARKASHAGSWYSDDPATLRQGLEKALEKAASNNSIQSGKNRVKAIITPHAGYAYCSNTAATAWILPDYSEIKRVFLLGPSHHKYIQGCSLPEAQCIKYETPLGDLPLDQEILDKLRETNKFSVFSLPNDEREHSIEMQLPFLRLMSEKSKDLKIIPIFVGEMSSDSLAECASILQPFFEQKDTMFVISSDFCHWGSRFNYYYVEVENAQQPLCDGIKAIDHRAIDFITKHSFQDLKQYHDRTSITICGIRPILLLINMINNSASPMNTQLLHYSQSNKAKSTSDSSVSYAALATMES